MSKAEKPQYFENESKILDYLENCKTSKILNDSAVEIEIELFDEILSILSTTDGTLNPIINNDDQLREVSALDFISEDPLGLLWDNFSLEKKREIIKTTTRFRGKTFKEDRTLDGIKVRDKIALNFKDEYEILGKRYLKGESQLDIDGAICLVEILSGGHVKNLEKIELHLRRDDLPGELSRSGQNILSALGVKKTHQHVHIVAKLPVDKIKSDPDGKIMELADNFRRVNLVSEMRAIVLRKKTIYRKDFCDTHNFFKYLNSDIFKGVIDYLYGVSSDDFRPIGDSLKKGWVGYRGHDKYDGEEHLHGFEHRDIKPEDDLNEVSKFLNATSYFLQRYSKEDTSLRVKKWINFIKERGAPRQLMIKCLYQKSFDEIKDELDVNLKDILDMDLLQKIKDVIKFEKRGKFDYRLNYQIKLLVHNFSFDPLVYDDPSFLELIRKTQVDSLSRIKNEEDPLLVIREFLINSKIYEKFNKSISF